MSKQKEMGRTTSDKFLNNLQRTVFSNNCLIKVRQYLLAANTKKGSTDADDNDLDSEDSDDDSLA